MFKRKYIFESQSTRFFRHLQGLFFIFTIFTVLYGLVCVMFIFVSIEQNSITKEALEKMGPDLIVVFAGDSGRIPYAFKTSQDYRFSKLLISGVNNLHTFDSFVKYHDKALQQYSLSPERIALDRASNTIENVEFTLEYLKQMEDVQKVLIISHDYHIMRIKMIIDSFTAKDTTNRRPYEFFYSGIRTDYSDPRNLRVLFKEVFKFLRVMVVLYVMPQSSIPN